MGYGIKAKLEALMILTGIVKEKQMAKKADNVRKAITDKLSAHGITEVVIHRAQLDHPDSWVRASIAQVSQILKVDLKTARALVSEHCQEKTK